MLPFCSKYICLAESGSGDFFQHKVHVQCSSEAPSVLLNMCLGHFLILKYLAK